MALILLLAVRLVLAAQCKYPIRTVYSRIPRLHAILFATHAPIYERVCGGGCVLRLAGLPGARVVSRLLNFGPLRLCGTKWNIYRSRPRLSLDLFLQPPPLLSSRSAQVGCFMNWRWTRPKLFDGLWCGFRARIIYASHRTHTQRWADYFSRYFSLKNCF